MPILPMVLEETVLDAFRADPPGPGRTGHAVLSSYAPGKGMLLQTPAFKNT